MNNEEAGATQKSDKLEDDEFLRCIAIHILFNVTLQGIENIKDVYMKNGKRIIITDSGAFEDIDEWVLKTDGTSLLKVLGERYVDRERTHSSDIREICQVLGIEAARKSTEKEIKAVLHMYGMYYCDRKIR